MIIEENLKHSATEELIKLQDCIKKMHTSAARHLKVLDDFGMLLLATEDQQLRTLTASMLSACHVEIFESISGSVDHITEQLTKVMDENKIQYQLQDIQNVVIDSFSLMLKMKRGFKGRIAPQIDTKSTICPKCSNVRVADGICWNIGCDYKTVMDAQDE